MTSLSNDKVPKALKIIALLLIGGGIFGIVMVISGGLQTPSQQSVNVVCAIVFAAVFGWCVLVGIHLWRGKPDAVRWAMILFAAQIPILSIPNFSYEFFTGLTGPLVVELSGSEVSFFYGIYFVAGLNLLFSPAIQNISVGINLVAVIVLLYLNKVAKSLSSPVTLSEIPSGPG